MTNISTNRMRNFGVALALILTVGTTGYTLIEGMSLLDALYFSIVTVATVGYGDFHPLTAGGKIFTILMIVAGAGTFLGVVASATELLVERRQEQGRRERVNMMVGLFFSEVGTELLRMIVRADPAYAETVCRFEVRKDWDAARLRGAIQEAQGLRLTLDAHHLGFEEMRKFLREHRDFLLRLLENPSLAEHERFTELLRTVFHLKSELLSRRDFSTLPASDLDHLALDVKRVYQPLTVAWFEHLTYLQGNYPYLYSLAVRTNPFCPHPSAIVSE